MTKKRIEMLKLMTSFMLVMILCISTAMPIFAADDTYAKGTEDKPAAAAVTKMLKMPIGTITPKAKFEFKFEPKSFNGKTTNGAIDLIPPIVNLNIEFNASDTGTTITEGGLKLVPKEGLIPFDITKVVNAGVYTYTVTETKNTYAIIDSFKEKMEYSTAVYDIEIWVENGANGKLYVSAIVAKIVVNDDYNKDEAVGDKVDPTPGGGEGTTFTHSQMVFTNVYLKNNGKDVPEEPEDFDKYTVLAISKQVTGSFADLSKLFEYSVTVTKPVTVTDTAVTYIAYVIDKDNKIVTSTANIAAGSLQTDKNGNKYIEFKTGDPLTVFLTHGQRLAFTDLPVGSSFLTSETGDPDYTPSYILTLNGAAKPKVDGTAGTTLTSTEERIGEAANKADYTNAYKLVTPTGIAVDNLPYVVLIAFALMALIGSMVIRSRRNTNAGYDR